MRRALPLTAPTKRPTKRRKMARPGEAYVMELMWAGFVSFAWGRPEFRAAFTKDTGIVLSSPAKSPLDAMIDKATGRAEHEAHEFVKWATITHWGLEYAPAEFRAARVADQP